jgi:ATP-binding cassette subfamily C (CFTR/MRP) protein 1
MLIINSTFAGYILLDNVITPQKAFTIISLFYILQEPIRSIPMVGNYLIEAYISIKRIEKYF